MVSTTQTLSQIKPQEIIGYIKQHFMTTSPLTYVTNVFQDFVKCYIKSWVDYNLQDPSIRFLKCLQSSLLGTCKTF